MFINTKALRGDDFKFILNGTTVINQKSLFYFLNGLFPLKVVIFVIKSKKQIWQDHEFRTSDRMNVFNILTVEHTDETQLGSFIRR